MDSTPLLERLAQHRTLNLVPRDQLAWLVSAGVEHTLEPGDVLTPSTGPVKGLYIVLDGHLLIRVDRGAGPRIVMEWHGGDVTGVLPYSRIKAPPGNVVAEERTTLLAIDADELPRMIRECHELTAVLVHVMVDRARVFKSSELLDEKMTSLGRLAAGLAHELNNPASAVARSAKTLVAELAVLDEATKRFCALNLSDAQCLTISSFRGDGSAGQATLAPLERADRQDAIDDWLVGARCGRRRRRAAGRLRISAGRPRRPRRAGRSRQGGDRPGAHVGRAGRPSAGGGDRDRGDAHSLAGRRREGLHLREPAGDAAAGRDRARAVRHDHRASLEGQGEIRRRWSFGCRADLPAVDGYGGELNQVWANLLDNAIDATPGGHVRIEAARDGGARRRPRDRRRAGHSAGRWPTASSIRSSRPRTSARAPASASTSRGASSSATAARSTCTRARAGPSSA